MKRPLAVLPFVLAAAAAQDPVVPAGISWHQDFDTARALAKRTGKPLLVTFRCEA